MRLRALFFALLLLPFSLPVASAAPASPVSATGPDAEGSWMLRYDVTMPAEATPTLRLLVTVQDGEARADASREVARRTFPAGTTPTELPFLPSEGAGEYAVALEVDGVASEPLRFSVAESGGASASVSFQVADEPLSLRLTNDTVNADGKMKSPGEAVVTRLVLEDANGLTGTTLLWRLEDERGAAVAAGEVPLPAEPNATSLSVEHRLARSPLAPGLHRAHFVAFQDGAARANLSRTFIVRDVAPALAAGNLSALPRGAEQSVDVVLSDRNGAPGPGPLEARLYRGSARVTTPGFEALLATEGRPTGELDGAARTAFALTVRAPASADPGAYRVSLYANGTLLGSLPFDLENASLALQVSPLGKGARLPLRFQVDAPGWDLSGVHANVTLARWDGASATELHAAWREGVVIVEGPANVTAGRYDARLSVTLPNGTRGEAAWSFEAGPWMRLTLDAPVVDGREARIPLRNEGGMPVARLVVEPGLKDARVEVVINGTSLTPRVSGERHVFSVALAPGEQAELRVRLPEGPLAPGARSATVRVLGLAGGA